MVWQEQEGRMTDNIGWLQGAKGRKKGILIAKLFIQTCVSRGSSFLRKFAACFGEQNIVGCLWSVRYHIFKISLLSAVSRRTWLNAASLR